MSMDRQEAIEFLVDHYNNPRNRGALDEADIDQVGGNPGCSDRVEMYARVDADGRIEEVSFETLIDDLGREVVMARPTCATVALGTLKQGAHELRMRRMAGKK